MLRLNPGTGTALALMVGSSVPTSPEVLGVTTARSSTLRFVSGTSRSKRSEIVWPSVPFSEFCKGTCSVTRTSVVRLPGSRTMFTVAIVAVSLNFLDDRFFEAGEIRFYPVNHRIKILDTVGTLLGGGHMIGLVGPKIRYRDGYVGHQGATLVHDRTADATSIGLRTRACRKNKRCDTSQRRSHVFSLPRPLSEPESTSACFLGTTDATKFHFNLRVTVSRKTRSVLPPGRESGQRFRTDKDVFRRMKHLQQERIATCCFFSASYGIIGRNGELFGEETECIHVLHCDTCTEVMTASCSV